LAWAPQELRLILSERRSTLQRDTKCTVCGLDISAGTKRCLSLGVVDRYEGTVRRWYVCPYCEELFSYWCPEDAPLRIQQYLYDARFSSEIWDNETNG
jgi:ferredoxin